MKTGAAFARGASKQSYSTPDEFIAAVLCRFGLDAFDFDLAATRQNTKAKRFFGPNDDALKQDWTRLKGHLWLNPPYDRIEPWAEKCAEAGAPERRIYFLIPAAVGANWFRDHVHLKALVHFLNGRISFDGKHPYPKDCLLACYGAPAGYRVWRWKETAAP